MATIYRFIVEQQQGRASAGGRKGDTTPSIKQVGKTTTLLKQLTGNKGGVEHNRKLRAVNPLINKAVAGWERTMRLGRAGLGLVKFNSQTGKFEGFSPVAIVIIIQMIIKLIGDIFNSLRQKNDRINTNNFKQMQVGIKMHNSEVKNTSNLFQSWFLGIDKYNDN